MIVSINVQIFVSICLKLFQLPGFKKRIEEVKKETGLEYGKVYLELRRRQGRIVNTGSSVSC